MSLDITPGDGIVGELELLGDLIVGGFPEAVFTLPGVSVDEVLDHARLYLGFAEAAESAHARVRGLEVPEFVGVEGEFFRGRVPGELAMQLGAAVESYSRVGSGIKELARELDASQAALKPLEARARAVFEHMQKVWIKVNVPFTEYSGLRSEWDELVRAAGVVHERVAVAGQQAAAAINAGTEAMVPVNDYFSTLPGGAVAGGVVAQGVRSTASRAASAAGGVTGAPGRAAKVTADGLGVVAGSAVSVPQQITARGQQLAAQVTPDGIKVGDQLLIDPTSEQAQKLVRDGHATNILGLDPTGVPTAMMMLASPNTLLREQPRKKAAGRRWSGEDSKAQSIAESAVGQVVSVPGRFVGGAVDRFGNTIAGNAALIGVGGDPVRAWTGLLSNVTSPVAGAGRAVASATPEQILADPVAAAGSAATHAPAAVPFVGWAYGLVEWATKPGELAREGAKETLTSALDALTLKNLEAGQVVANTGEVHVTTSDVDVHADNGGYVTFTLPDLEGGEPKAWYIMATPDSPGNFTTDVATGPGEELVERADGSVVVVNTRTGEDVRLVKTPWAKDALGRDQPTWYSVEKIDDQTSTITQHIQPNKGALYPLIADAPKVVECRVDGTLVYDDGSTRKMEPPQQTKNTVQAQQTADAFAPTSGPGVQVGPYTPGNSPAEQNQKIRSETLGTLNTINPAGTAPVGQQPTWNPTVTGGTGSQAAVEAQRITQQRNQVQYEANLRAAAEAEAKAREAREQRDTSSSLDATQNALTRTATGPQTDDAPASTGSATQALAELSAAKLSQTLAASPTNSMGPHLPDPAATTATPTTFIGPATGVPFKPEPKPFVAPITKVVPFVAGVGTGTVDAVEGTVQAIAHPIDTAKAMAPLVGLGDDGIAVRDAWKQVARAMVAADDFERGDSAYASGKVVANVLTAIVGTKGTTALSKAGKAAAVSEFNRLVDLGATAPKPEAWAQAIQQAQARVTAAEQSLQVTKEAAKSAGKNTPAAVAAAAAGTATHETTKPPTPAARVEAPAMPKPDKPAFATTPGVDRRTAEAAAATVEKIAIEADRAGSRVPTSDTDITKTVEVPTSGDKPFNATPASEKAGADAAKSVTGPRGGPGPETPKVESPAPKPDTNGTRSVGGFEGRPHQKPLINDPTTLPRHPEDIGQWGKAGEGITNKNTGGKRFWAMFQEWTSRVPAEYAFKVDGVPEKIANKGVVKFDVAGYSGKQRIYGDAKMGYAEALEGALKSVAKNPNVKSLPPQVKSLIESVAKQVETLQSKGVQFGVGTDNRYAVVFNRTDTPALARRILGVRSGIPSEILRKIDFVSLDDFKRRFPEFTPIRPENFGQ
ncbi:hypothetical protein ACLQ3K_04380 [Tsukamurella sp. DT100]|uniref:hypothetical protein n=1 Tax=Tsukamurella sp. DT100 TaxID=3393415 RepID=UPI003CFBA799